ncbi:glycosyl hydrolase [Bisporella sp. PMI_857]|nr:glycosyl hydrolase [Bisporella sp. PMI_857]
MSTQIGTYTNPIIPGFNPDPSIIRSGSSYFLVTSSFEYFPGIPIYHSTDLVKWRLVGHVLTRKSQLDVRTPEPGGGIWAATIREHKGRYYVMSTCYDRYRPQADDRVWPRGFYVWTDDIWKGEWSDPVYFDQVGFDQDLFWDDDGTVYLSTTYRMLKRTPCVPQIKDFAIHICTVDLPTGRCTSAPKLIRSSASGVAEGSHILKRGRYYYLFTAEGGTESGHCEWVSRSESGPFGPWELGPRNPLWRNGTGDEVQNTGHADFVVDESGNWWAVLLGVRPVNVGGQWKASVFGRETFLVPMAWEDDWPVINGGQKITLHSSGPGLYQLEQEVKWRDDFTEAALTLGWYRKNTPQRTDFSLSENPGNLRLWGGPYTLSVPTCPTLFLRKQTSHSATWETQLSFNPTTSNTEAGTVVWWNYLTYSSIGIRLSRTDPNKRILSLRPAEGEEVLLDLQTQDADVRLVIECGSRYRFGFVEVISGEEIGNVQWVGEVSNEAMTADPPVGAAFTGMMLGLYAFGELEGSLVPADFRYAEFR